jgi:hypothetical protein
MFTIAMCHICHISVNENVINVIHFLKNMKNFYNIPINVTPSQDYWWHANSANESRKSSPAL